VIFGGDALNVIDHIGLSVSDYERALSFYEQALKPLGIATVMKVPAEHAGGHEAAGLGRNGKPEFWISGEGRTTPHTHIAFIADNRAAVDAFHKAALAAGGKDNGAPGVRAYYHPNYYGAFVLDPDGHNIEAVCHQPA
jgi:catechol 2,3-dioxygenase-like lactoylglutathione lyase family enzyme